ncbi:hypothetical protein BJ170DRAFT_603734 [Xylariales sp. AK1849]|nr:hypothetical protein BJ170DRAFT_603734 [Xylariales sp. AK1849]
MFLRDVLLIVSSLVCTTWYRKRLDTVRLSKDTVCTTFPQERPILMIQCNAIGSLKPDGPDISNERLTSQPIDSLVLRDP